MDAEKFGVRVPERRQFRRSAFIEERPAGSKRREVAIVAGVDRRICRQLKTERTRTGGKRPEPRK